MDSIVKEAGFTFFILSLRYVAHCVGADARMFPLRTRFHMKAYKGKSSSRRGQTLGLAVLGVVAALGAIWFFVVAKSRASQGSSTNKPLHNKLGMDTSPLVEKSSSLERKEIDGVDVLLERPSTPKGILFVGHGCHHTNTDWWPSTPGICPECIGLPEEQAIVKMALTEFELMVVAISSVDRSSKCWGGTDGPRVAKVLTTLENEIMASSSDKQNIHVLAFGASSGGSFVGRKLISAMKAIGRPLDGFIAQIAAPDCRKDLPQQKGGPFPISAYITMNKDEGSDEFVKVIVEDLQRQEYHAKHIRLPPLPLKGTFFHDRIPEYSVEKSKAMILALERSSYMVVDNDNNYLAFDPRSSQWRDVLREHVACPPDCLEPDESPVSEVLNVAWGMHEMTREGVHEAIAFILKELVDRGSPR
jgi:hypothetical protein